MVSRASSRSIRESFCKGAKSPGIPGHAQCIRSFQPYPCIVIPQGVDQRLHGPGITRPS
jgi:hypothetical protein